MALAYWTLLLEFASAPMNYCLAVICDDNGTRGPGDNYGALVSAGSAPLLLKVKRLSHG